MWLGAYMASSKNPYQHNWTHTEGNVVECDENAHGCEKFVVVKSFDGVDSCCYSVSSQHMIS